jgi:multidrug resistance efflux pump
MDLLLILTYTAFCIAIFKIFKIPVNKWSMTTAVLGGIFLIGGMLLLMNYNHPYSPYVQRYYVTTPIVPNVSGTVVEVPIQKTSHVSKGDVLFRLDPIPFQNNIDALKAKLFRLEQDQERAVTLYTRGAGSKQDVDRAQSLLDENLANISQAEWELDQTVFRAPDNGYIVQVALRSGMRAVNLPLRPVMTFIHDDSPRFIGFFRQNSMLRLKKGYEAELSFSAFPGKIFKAKVDLVSPVIGEGQVDPSQALLRTSQMRFARGFIAVAFVITDPDFENYRDQAPRGMNGVAAVYTEHFHHVSIIRRILLRMFAWLNYVFPIK